MAGPIFYLYERTGQARSCLQGLVSYAKEIAKTTQARQLGESELLQYLWASPIAWDEGEGPTVQGCTPAQRSRIWPLTLNCWEATAHFAGWVIAQRLPLEVHIFDVNLGRVRHVFPAVRYQGETHYPEAMLLQPPTGPKNLPGLVSYGMGRSEPAQAWYNDLLGGLHVVGDTVLRAYGLGGAADKLAEVEGDALPDWARSKKQQADRDAIKAEQAKEKEKATKASAAQKVEASLPPPPPANALYWTERVPGGIRNYGPPIC